MRPIARVDRDSADGPPGEQAKTFRPIKVEHLGRRHTVARLRRRRFAHMAIVSQPISRDKRGTPPASCGGRACHGPGARAGLALVTAAAVAVLDDVIGAACLGPYRSMTAGRSADRGGQSPGAVPRV